MKTRILTLIVSLFVTAMTFASVEINVIYSVEINGIYYDLDAENKTAEVTFQEMFSYYNYYGITTLTIPSSVTYNSETYSVTSIGSYTFDGCSSLTSITIPNSVTSIGNYAFRYCDALTSITIPNNVTSIGGGAFEGCTSLTSIKWNAKKCNDFYLSEHPFYELKEQITSFTLGDSVEHIPAHLCEGMNNLTSITIPIPNSVTSIGNGAFNGYSSRTSINITAKSIKDYCENSDINKLLSYKGWSRKLLINGEEINNLVIPEGIDSIKDYTFYNYSSLTSISIPNSVTSIGKSAFEGCTSLTSITIPNSVTSIGNGAFNYCDALTSILIQAENPPTIGDDTFGSIFISIKVPCGSIEKYKTAEYWNEFENIAEPEIPFLVNINSNDVAMGYAEITNQDCRNNGIIIVAVPSYWGYHFVKWSDGNTENPRTIIVTEDLTLTAEFAINQYQVEVKSNGNGSVTGSGKYDHGTEITIEATANENYHFVQWSDGNIENRRTFFVTENINLTAEFAINQYNVVVKSNGNGSVIGSGTYDYGTEITIGAIADKGYNFVKWSDGNTENPRTITVTEDLTLTAEFAIHLYQVEIKSNDNGSVIGSGTYNYGAEITIGAIADKGYHFVKWSDGNTENPRMIVVTEDIELSATFELDKTTPIENTQITSANVYSHNGILHIEDAKTDYYILDMAGRLVYSGRDTQVQLPRGVYVVSVNGELQKVVL